MFTGCGPLLNNTTCLQDVVSMMVSATAGTTVLGAYDDVTAIADVCERHGVWLHTDASWGGGALLSSTHKHLLSGIERSVINQSSITYRLVLSGIERSVINQSGITHRHLLSGIER